MMNAKDRASYLHRIGQHVRARYVEVKMLQTCFNDWSHFMDVVYILTGRGPK